jgi:prepilin-type processing-associated H-X9-DG protein
MVPPPRRSSGSVPTIAIVAIVVGGMAVLMVPILIALLLPAVQAAREAARRAQCMNNLKQIGLAIQEYHDVNNMFPPAYILDASGKPMHSWRVLILPYLEHKALYDQYRLDEPWDGPNNRHLADLMPLVYSCPSDPDAQGSHTTDYAVVNGPGAIFDGDQQCRFATIQDGMSNTLLVVEASGAAIHWMEPRDLDLLQMQCVVNGTSGNEISSHHPNAVNVGFADGSARVLHSGISPMTLRALITRAGGEVIGGDF